ncbi:DUF998 domain-containing protein [Actinomycetospora lemnae]|uniref:DUF998 domain-containing protein n=1 Tax=Actinomycetospora lemnae TaxID=3019891 RepID=A0ABT5T294_9PSEU|nr:DUF998 domain-containing protein [Actinomycetospora sp. DW7H6]MDD7968506.1 DUF998 domain-containing protein [Actinomycetospora sp. DW7H6]
MATSARERELVPAEPHDRARPGLIAALALAAPLVLVVGALLAEAAQPPGAYDAVGQTVSTLAGRAATDRWIMAGALALVGVLYVLIAAGLRGVSRPGRAVLGLGGAAVVVAALAAQPAHGSSTVHMAATVTGAVAFALWPIPLVADRRLDPVLRRGSLVAVVAMLALLGWLCAQAWTDGAWLGAAERALLLAETAWPLVVAARIARPAPATVAALLGPVVFVVGVLAAQAAQPGPDPLGQSVSALSGHAATSRWIMTGTILLVGALTVATALALRPRVPPAAWRLLAAGGVFLVVAGLSPQPVGGYSAVHMVAGGLAWASYTIWPLGLVASPAVDRRLRVASAVATGVLVVLVAWFAVQLVTTGTWYGLSQRIVVLAQAVWPVVVAVHVSGLSSDTSKVRSRGEDH